MKNLFYTVSLHCFLVNFSLLLKDIDECALSSDNCDTGTSDCFNSEGSYICRCKTGFYEQANGTCIGKHI